MGYSARWASYVWVTQARYRSAAKRHQTCEGFQTAWLRLEQVGLVMEVGKRVADVAAKAEEKAVVEVEAAEEVGDNAGVPLSRVG